MDGDGGADNYSITRSGHLPQFSPAVATYVIAQVVPCAAAAITGAAEAPTARDHAIFFEERVHTQLLACLLNFCRI